MTAIRVAEGGGGALAARFGAGVRGWLPAASVLVGFLVLWELVVRALQDALQGALYVLDESIDGFGPTRQTAITDIRWAIAAAKSWRRRADAPARQVPAAEEA